MPKQPEYCMLCAEVHSGACGGTPKPVKAKRPKVTPTFALEAIQAAPPEVVEDDRTFDITMLDSIDTVATVGASHFQQSNEDADFAASLRALAPILHPDETASYAYLLDTEPSRKEKVIAWTRVKKWYTDLRSR